MFLDGTNYMTKATLGLTIPPHVMSSASDFLYSDVSASRTSITCVTKPSSQVNVFKPKLEIRYIQSSQCIANSLKLCCLNIKITQRMPELFGNTLRKFNN